MSSPAPESIPLPEGCSLSSVRPWLAQLDEGLHRRFDALDDIVTLVRFRAASLDRLLVHLWQQVVAADDLVLVAVGGYGRGELHPFSDIDLMVLHQRDDNESLREPLALFFTLLWDLKLDVGHSVRTIDDCVRQSREDVAIATNLMEARCLCGPGPLFEQMVSRLAAPDLWPGREYFAAKLAEQVERHQRFDDTVYNLEPNIKKGLGGLRDIQMVGWVAKRHYGVQRLKGLVEVGFLDDEEYQALRLGLRYLWRVRWALHRLAGRGEDRLLFDYQRDLALQLGFVDEQGNMAVEQFMQEYFRTVMQLERFNERLLQSFEEDILLAEEAAEAQPLGSSFVLLKGYLQAADDDIFRRSPVTIIELFELLQQNPDIKGVRAATARALRRSLDVVDEEFRADPNVRQRFIALLRAGGDVPGLLARMHHYGVLGRYLPVFGLIEGRMQYDLFHVYTVDQHTLFVLRNLYRFAIGGSNVEAFPLVTEIYARLPRPELLYLGGFFHDIAKGRGGDHSQLGEADAAVFCTDHDLSESHTALVCWLVRNHLLMSVTAQRQDISDPEVVNRFAREVGNLLYLDYLYLLTLADISATSPKLWNSWKAALLSDLYRLARQAIQRGLGNPVRRSRWIEDSRREARAQLLDSGMDSALLDRLWLHLPDEYFLRVSVEQIVWQTGEMAAADGGTTVGVRRKTDRGTTEVFVHADNVDGTFATIVATLGLLDLNIVDARVFNTGDEWVMDTFQVLDQRGQSLDDPGRAERIAAALTENLAIRPLVPPCQRRVLPRRLSHFVRAPEITFSPARDDPRTMMELNCSDRPGLLARVAEVLLENGVRVHGARIATFGERVEDYFLLSDGQDAPLDADTEQVLATALQARLGEGMPAALDIKDTDQ